jgi:hypothetical protein
MNPARGQTIPLSLPRRWVGDLLAFGQSVPTVVAERVLQIQPLASARKRLESPPRWCALIMKCFGLASQRIPELRRSYLGFPYSRLYEHPSSVATIVLQRDFIGELAVMPALIQAPESLSLADLELRLQQLNSLPFEEIGCFRRLIKTTKLPGPLRRLLWWYGLSVSGRTKSKTFGTFSCNSVAKMGIQLRQFVTPITSSIYYTPDKSTDELTIAMAFDHRVFDAEVAGRALNDIESLLNREMVEEIRGMT